MCKSKRQMLLLWSSEASILVVYVSIVHIHFFVFHLPIRVCGKSINVTFSVPLLHSLPQHIYACVACVPRAWNVKLETHSCRTITITLTQAINIPLAKAESRFLMYAHEYVPDHICYNHNETRENIQRHNHWKSIYIKSG